MKNIQTYIKDLEDLLESIDIQIAEVHLMASIVEIPVYRMKDHHGDLVLSQLLHAKATAFLALMLARADEC